MIWERQPKETVKSFRAFMAYLLMEPKRSIARLAMAEGWDKTTCERWSRKHGWVQRCEAYDAHLLTEAIRTRELVQERVRQRLIDGLDKAVDALFGLLEGELQDFGASVPILDRHGNEVGQAPIVKPSTRLQAAKEILDRAGITVPKRIELTGADGRELLINAQAAVSQLSNEQLEALSKAFEGG